MRCLWASGASMEHSGVLMEHSRNTRSARHTTMAEFYLRVLEACANDPRQVRVRFTIDDKLNMLQIRNLHEAFGAQDRNVRTIVIGSTVLDDQVFVTGEVVIGAVRVERERKRCVVM